MERAQRRTAVITLLGAYTEVKDKLEKPDTLTEVLEGVFGHIAIIGTSNKAVYPSVVILHNKDCTRTDFSKGVKFPLRSFVLALKGLGKSADNEPIAGSTLRQFCDPFAEEARSYLLRAATWGSYSQLALKLAKLGQKEPQVCFDFSKGLDLLHISVSEAQVIQSLHSRLFRTEGAKGVFAAQSSVGEQAVEI
uniref:Coat protein n=4 Tax=Arracacha latent virus V TaxID=2057934 RepID=A0A3S7HAW0_9VIRU|nr:coat protein [Arracacha latent virus V]